MKKIQNIFSTALFVVFSIITISQTSRTASALVPLTGPLTSAATPTPTTAPVTSAATPTPTLTSTPVPTATPTPNNSSNNSNNNNNNSNSNNNNSNNNSNNNNGNSNNNSNSCSAEKPKIPVIYASKLSGKGAITLTWTKVNENVTYYLITYSRKPGVTEYATGNISASANSFTVRGLTGKGSFYFRIRAGNGCKPGDFSNEVVVSAAGKILRVNPPKAAKSVVLGTNSKKQVTKKTANTVINKRVKTPYSTPTSWIMKKVFG